LQRLSLNEYSEEEKLARLKRFCQFKSLKLVFANPPTNEEKLNALLLKRAGACRHRALVFSALCDLWGISYLIALNNVHSEAWAYSSERKRWERMNLGGFRSNLSIEPFALNEFYDANHLLGQSKEIEPLEKPQEKEPTKDLNLPIVITPEKTHKEATKVDEKKEHSHLLAGSNVSPFARPKKMFNSITSCFMELLMGDRPAAVILPSSTKALWLNEAKVFWGNHIKIIKPEAIDLDGFQVTSSGVTRAPSELEQFMAKKARVYLVLDMSDFKLTYVPIYTALADERKLDQHILPLNVQPIILLSDQVFSTRGKDFCSRFVLLQSEHYSASLNLSFRRNVRNKTGIIHYDLYESTDYEALLIGKYQSINGQFHAVEGALVKALKDKANGEDIREFVIDHPPQTTAFKTWFETTKENKEVYFNGNVVKIPQNFRLEIGSTAYNFSDYRCTLHSGMPLVFNSPSTTSSNLFSCSTPLWDLNSETLSLFEPHLVCDNVKKQFVPRPSLFEGHAHQQIAFWVTEPLPIGNFYKLLTIAKIHKVELALYGCEHFFSALQKSTLPITASPSPLFKNPNVITTDDILFCAEQYRRRYPEQHYETIEISEETTFDDLVGVLNVEKRGEFDFDVTFKPGILAKKLLEEPKQTTSANSILLLGEMHPHLAAQLSTAWLPKGAYLWVNGEKKFLKGQLTVITKPLLEPLAFLPTETEPYPVESFYPLLEEKYSLIEAKLVANIKTTVKSLEREGVKWSYERLLCVFEMAQTEPLENPFKPFLQLEKEAEKYLTITRKFFPKAEKIANNKKANEKEEETHENKHLKKLKRAFGHNRRVFMVGTTGAGKSYFMEHSLARYFELFDLNATNVEEILLAYATSHSDKPKLLVIDEINLLEKRILKRLSTIHDHILIDGFPYPLTDKHFILGAGNRPTYRGRQEIDYFYTMYTTVFHPPKPKQVLEEVIKPILGLQSDVFWDAYQKKYPENVRKTRASADKALRYAVKQSRKKEIYFKAGTLFEGLYIAPNWEKGLKRLEKAIEVQKYKMAQGLTCGRAGILLEGDSSLAKTHFIGALLRYKGIPFIDLTGVSLSKIEGLVQTAVQDKKWLVVDEVNTVIPLFEATFNKIMSSGQCVVIGTLNPASKFASRLPLSPALDDRFTSISIEPYTATDIENIFMRSYHFSPQKANELTLSLLLGKQQNPDLTFRDIVNHYELKLTQTPVLPSTQPQANEITRKPHSSTSTIPRISTNTSSSVSPIPLPLRQPSHTPRYQHNNKILTEVKYQKN